MRDGDCLAENELEEIKDYFEIEMLHLLNTTLTI